MAETWRVVLADGSVREVRVEISPDGRVWAESADGAAEGAGADARLAVMRVARFLGVSVREILAPGEPTRAEAVAFERGRDAVDEAGARAMRAAALRDAVAAERERCARLCDEVAAERDALGAASMAARECAAHIRAGGV